MVDPFAPVRGLLTHCVKLWQINWVPGTHLVVDESMVDWSGATTGHLSWIPRKPHPLGFQLKTVVDAVSLVLLNIDIVEGREADRLKEFMEETGHKQTTATTLRLVKPFFGSKRVVIGDSWFGSLRTAEELAERGLHSILCVKTGHAGYPMEDMRARLSRRGDSHFMQIGVKLGYYREGDEVKFLAGGHMDKKPLTLVGDVGMTLPGPPKRRHRYRYQGGNIVHNSWTLE